MLIPIISLHVYFISSKSQDTIIHFDTSLSVNEFITLNILFYELSASVVMVSENACFSPQIFDINIYRISNK